MMPVDIDIEDMGKHNTMNNVSFKHFAMMPKDFDTVLNYMIEAKRFLDIMSADIRDKEMYNEVYGSTNPMGLPVLLSLTTLLNYAGYNGRHNNTGSFLDCSVEVLTNLGYDKKVSETSMVGLIKELNSFEK